VRTPAIVIRVRGLGPANRRSLSVRGTVPEVGRQDAGLFGAAPSDDDVPV